MRSSFFRAAIGAVFFLSGAAGLTYEVVWTRELSLIFGVTTYAVSTVLATFMGGLALGSYVFGRWIDRRQNPLIAYALLEAAVGLYALAVGTLFAALRPTYIALHQLDWPYLLVAIGRAALAALVLIVPTTLMGGTFPILVRFFVRARDDVGRSTGVLYFVNTAGALAGCLAAGFFLIERFGLSGATRCAAASSLTAALVAAVLSRRVDVERSRSLAHDRADLDQDSVDEPANTGLALVCIGISGFASLGYEVLWTRALLRYLYNSTYAFTTMLATFLAGLALGSALHAAVLRRSRRPLLVFAGLELWVGLGFVLSAYLFTHLLGASALVLRREVVGSFGQSAQAMFVRAALILLLPAVGLGATLPLATEICTRALSSLGRSVGRVYAVNTLGCIVGSLATGFVLIPAIGMQGTLTVLIGVNLCLGLVLIVAHPSPAPRRVAAGAAVSTLLVAVVAGLPRDLFKRSFAPPGQSILFYDEGATDTVGVTEAFGQRAILYDDQRGTSGTSSYGWNFLLGHLPLLLHPGEPRKVLHICFGVGNSLSAVAAHDSLERIDNVELSPHVLQAARFFWTNNDVLSDPRVHTVIDDGRNFLMASRETYDVILLEPPEVFTAGVINLYTREFYRDAADHLAPDGVMMQWIPYAEAPLDEERMLFRAFYDVFPNATAWKLLEGGPILFIGTKSPLTIDYQRLKDRMQAEHVRQDLNLIHVANVDHLLAFFIFDSSAFRDFALPAQPVTDDRTVLDFSMPRYLGSGFGLGTFNRAVFEDGHGPFDAVLERARFYFDHRSSIVPLLTNVGDEDPRAIEARVTVWAKPNAPPPPPIPEGRWHRW